MATDEFEKENEKIAWIMAGIILIITVVLIGTLLWSTHQDAQSGNACILALFIIYRTNRDTLLIQTLQNKL